MIVNKSPTCWARPWAQERLFKTNLLRLAKILQHLQVMSVKELGDMRSRMSKTSGDEKKLLKAELEKEREKNRDLRGGHGTRQTFGTEHKTIRGKSWPEPSRCCVGQTLSKLPSLCYPKPGRP